MTLVAEKHIWNDLPLTSYESPFSYQFSYPENWQIKTERSSVRVGPKDGLFSPIVAFTAQINEPDLASLRARFLRQFRRDGAIAVQEVRQLRQPRPALLIVVSSRLETGRALRRYYVVELLDPGKLCLVFIISDSENEQKQFEEYDYLLRVWQASKVSFLPAAPDYRLLGFEHGHFAFEFPEHWIIQRAEDDLVEIRSPARSALQPNIILQKHALLDGQNLTQIQNGMQAYIQDNLFDIHDLKVKKLIRVGKKEGVEIQYKKRNQNDSTDRVITLLTLLSKEEWLQITLSGMDARWDEYDPVFRHVRGSFRWMDLL